MPDAKNVCSQVPGQVLAHGYIYSFTPCNEGLVNQFIVNLSVIYSVNMSYSLDCILVKLDLALEEIVLLYWILML